MSLLEEGVGEKTLCKAGLHHMSFGGRRHLRSWLGGVRAPAASPASIGGRAEVWSQLKVDWTPPVPGVR